MKWKLLSLGFLLLVLGFAVSPPCQAAPVWSDNFNDLNYNGWTIHEGTFSAADANLACGPDIWNFIHHPSTLNCGKWEFDVFVNSTVGIDVFFMAQDLTGSGVLFTQNSYFLRFNPYDGWIRLYKRESGSPSVLRSYMTPISLGTLFEVVVCRNSTGGFNVWLDGVERMEAVSTHLDSSTYFVVRITESGYIDNIVVDDEPCNENDDSEDNPLLIDPILLAVALGVVAIAIIIIVVFVIIRRRR